MILRTLIATLLAVASYTASAQDCSVPFTVVQVEVPRNDPWLRDFGLKVTSITDERRNDGGIKVGDILLDADLPRGNRRQLYSIGDLSAAVQENCPTGIIWFMVRTKDQNGVVRHAKLGQ